MLWKWKLCENKEVEFDFDERKTTNWTEFQNSQRQNCTQWLTFTVSQNVDIIRSRLLFNSNWRTHGKNCVSNISSRNLYRETNTDRVTPFDEFSKFRNHDENNNGKTWCETATLLKPLASLRLNSRLSGYQHSRKIDCAQGVPHATPTSDMITVARCSLDTARKCRLARNTAASLSELSTSCRTDGYIQDLWSHHRFWTTHNRQNICRLGHHADLCPTWHKMHKWKHTFTHRTKTHSHPRYRSINSNIMDFPLSFWPFLEQNPGF